MSKQTYPLIVIMTFSFSYMIVDEYLSLANSCLFCSYQQQNYY